MGCPPKALRTVPGIGRRWLFLTWFLLMFLLFVESIISSEPFIKEPGQWHQPWKKNHCPLHPGEEWSNASGAGGPRSCSLRPGLRSLGYSPPLLEYTNSMSSSLAATPKLM